MCTAITYKTRDFYFGRTLDNDFSYGEEVVITARRFPFNWRNGQRAFEHYAIIGMAYVCDGYPLYYDAVNEKGLCMAGLNFVGNAVYYPVKENKENIAQFELIPRLLGRCESVEQVKNEIEKINVTKEPFSDELKVSQLHWIIADRLQSITVECVADGIRVYDNPVGVLTNNPPFEYQLFALNNYMSVSPRKPCNFFSKSLDLQEYSRGMGGLGLPGDLSSQSRFVRAAFARLNSVSGESESECVGQLFHILSFVEQPRGCCVLDNGGYEITQYASCCNVDKGIYYYTTYSNRQISAVNLYSENLDSNSLFRYPLVLSEQINRIN